MPEEERGGESWLWPQKGGGTRNPSDEIILYLSIWYLSISFHIYERAWHKFFIELKKHTHESEGKTGEI